MHRSSRTAITLMAVASTMPVVITVANAGESNYTYSGLASREMARRAGAVAEGDRLIAEGRDAYHSGLVSGMNQIIKATKEGAI